MNTDVQRYCFDLATKSMVPVTAPPEETPTLPVVMNGADKNRFRNAVIDECAAHVEMFVAGWLRPTRGLRHLQS